MSIFLDAPWVPTKKETIRKMLKFAELNPNEVLYDLGSGDGRIPIIAAQEFKVKRAVGIELNPFWVAISNLRIFTRRLQDKVQIIWGNIFMRNISEADVVTMYLLQVTNDRMKEKLKKELKPGSRIVSKVYIFQDWEPKKVDEENEFFLYQV
ncbi:MAG: SAM-dependent methyltransferase [Candidatus Helarchaeota archaeon]